MTSIINFIYKYTMLSSLSVYIYSKIFNKNILYHWYKPTFIFWISLTNIYLLVLFQDDIKKLIVNNNK